MKKYYAALFLMVLLIMGANAQITITKSDMPKPGDTVRLSTTTNITGLPGFDLTGANYTWDYSMLTPMSQKVDTFLSVTSTPFAYQFFFNNVFIYPNYVATVAQAAPNLPAIGPVTVTNVINYYKAGSSAYENLGFGANIDLIPTSVKEDTIDNIYDFPMNYGNADSCNSKYHVTIPLIGYYGARQFRVNHVDGWGTLKTPYGTFQTLRVTTELFVTDTLYIDTVHFGFAVPQPEQLQYKWLALGEKEPVLQINESVIANVPILTSIVYRDSARVMPNAVVQINAPVSNVKLYPNPAAGIIYLLSTSLVNNAKVAMYNVMGQMVFQTHINRLEKDSPYKLNISSLTPGVYYLKLSSGINAQTFKVVKE